MRSLSFPLSPSASTIRALVASATFSLATVFLLSAPTRATAQTPASTPAPSPAAASSPAPTSAADIIGVAEAAGNFKTFLKALDAAGMTAALKKPGPYTVFLPTDAAFTKLSTGTLDGLLKPENKTKLVALLSYHIVSHKLTAAEIGKMEEIKTMEGSEVDVDLSTDGKTLEIDDSKVITSDLAASNGIIHVIDKVLQP